MWYLWAGRQCRTHVIIKLPDIQWVNIQIAIPLTVQLLQLPPVDVSACVLLDVTIWTPHCSHWYPLIGWLAATDQPTYSCMHGATWDAPLTCRNTSSQPIHIMQLPRVALWQPVVETGRAHAGSWHLQLSPAAATGLQWQAWGSVCSSCVSYMLYKHFDTCLLCVITQQW